MRHDHFDVRSDLFVVIERLDLSLRRQRVVHRLVDGGAHVDTLQRLRVDESSCTRRGCVDESRIIYIYSNRILDVDW